MDEKVKDSFIAAIFVFFVLLLLLSSCALVALLFLIPENGAITAPEEIQEEQPETPPEEPVPPPISAADLERWEMITLENAEDGCLRVARDEAGSSASFVYSCDCVETIGEGRKTYSCDIDTADPFTRYFAEIDCFLENATCSIETNYGVLTLTFQEMEEWYQ